MWLRSENRAVRLGIVLVIVLLGVAADQYTKKMAIDRRAANPQGDTFYFFDFVRITYAENPGAFLSLGANLSEAHRFWVLTGLNTSILAVVLAVLLIKHRLYFVMVASLALVVSGGIGNLIDRIFRNGHVVDFLVVGLQDRNIPFRTGIFNVADALIMLGLGLLIFSEFFGPKTIEEPEARDTGIADANGAEREKG